MWLPGRGAGARENIAGQGAGARGRGSRPAGSATVAIARTRSPARNTENSLSPHKKGPFLFRGEDVAASWELVSTSQFSLSSCLTFIPASPGRPGSPTAPGGPCKKMPLVPPTARAGFDCKGGDNRQAQRGQGMCLRSHSRRDTELGAGYGLLGAWSWDHGEGGGWAHGAEPWGCSEAAGAFSFPTSVVYHIKSPLASTGRKIA